MIFLEVVALLVIATVLITVIQSIGRPVAEMLAEKTRFKFKGLGSEAEQKLIQRVEALEEELRQTNNKLGELKDATDFAVKMIESKVEKTKQIAQDSFKAD